jgi:hypothetical protein
MLRALQRLLCLRDVRRRRPHLWRPSPETLEDRTVPAGNVLADQVGTTLTLVGDALGNSVQLLPGSQPGEILVQGVGTTVNGAAGQTFTGVENLFAHLLDGDDTLRANGVSISAASFSQIFVDGNAGDDRIEFIDSTFHAVSSVDVLIYGDRVFGTFASGTSGNDTIRLTGTSITSQALVSVKIYGETNDGGVVTGGNDTILLADSVLSAGGGFFHAVVLEVYGDVNTSVGGRSSTIGGGNDSITVRGTTISAATGPFVFGNQATVTLVGDFNSANAFNPDTFAADNAISTIGGGNDSISIENSTVSVSGETFGTSQTVLTVVGDRNFASGVPGGSAVATIGGGNDSITVADSAIAATGGQFGNGVFAEIRGEDIQVGGPEGPGTVSTIGGGADAITVRNGTVTAAGPSSDIAALTIWGEFLTVFGGVSVIGSGDDVVKVQSVQLLTDSATDFGVLTVEGGPGDDRVTINDSSARFFTVHLGDGDDELKFNANAVGEEASLDGGPGHDRLWASDNLGLLIWFDFEDEHVTP